MAAADRGHLAALLAAVAADPAALADALIVRFGSLAAVLAAAPEAIAAVPGGSAAAPWLASLRAAWHHVLRGQAAAAPLLSGSAALIDYLKARLAGLAAEQFLVLFLDTRNRLIRDEPSGAGTIDEAAVYAREVMRRALELGASGLILVHNHPSGDPAPSRQDVATTRRLCEAARALDIQVHDHLIIAAGGWTSLRAQGLL